jgi:hypothetical protein
MTETMAFNGMSRTYELPAKDKPWHPSAVAATALVPTTVTTEELKVAGRLSNEYLAWMRRELTSTVKSVDTDLYENQGLG